MELIEPTLIVIVIFRACFTEVQFTHSEHKTGSVFQAIQVYKFTKITISALVTVYIHPTTSTSADTP